ncbi:molybdenum cofactor guanylyltransferase MobA [Rhodovulum tesquicola]|uniref:molybdenum cofactor guanylyltransferase MobA n=1 Tax=Rhodovulum tesquicola TaxID=540254 RepID=UPI0020971385|nr:molybdenum cofactor guanylyltransferase MobA [Rhodovulum tesquicola]MCO8143996.1 molybdenum cofactor guanylyltransferase MobA [Rhodovulum tesquicola]
MQVVGVILAGGQGRRMGGVDKALIRLGGTTFLARVAARLGPQVAAMALSANGPVEDYAEARLPVLADPPPGDLGPLAGVLAGLDWAAEAGADAVATVAVDTPFLPVDLVARLGTAAGGELAVAASGGRMHPTAALWPVGLRAEVCAALARGERRLGGFAHIMRAVTVGFEAEGIDPFFNINTPDDLALAEAALHPTGP